MDTQVLVIDLAAKEHEFFRTKIKELFALAGISARVEATTSIDRAFADAEQGKLDVLVTDLTFNRDEGYALTFIQDLKLKFPEVFVVALTWGDVLIKSVQARSPSFDLIVGKQSLSAAQRAQFEGHGRALRRLYRRLPSLPIELEGCAWGDLLIHGEQMAERTLGSLLGQVYGDLTQSMHEA